MKIPVGILGATGMVGQQYLKMLLTHPYFEVVFLAASDQSAGKSYADAVKGKWYLNSTPPEMKVHSLDDIAEAKKSCRIVFSAVSTEAGRIYEEKYAEAGLIVVSNTSAHRFTIDVPMLIPEVNPEHLDIIPIQQKNRGWGKGLIVVKPNCSLQSYLIPLFPLHEEFKIKKLIITTLQAMSGAGANFSISDNVIPYIAHEEEKSEREPLKILGAVVGNEITMATGIDIAAHCNRVPVVDGHMACVSVEFEKKPSENEILALWENFTGEPQRLKLPSAPEKPIIYFREQDRPQPQLDRDVDKGMAVTVGRLRTCPVFDYRFTALSHNTVRGAAGGGVLNAELLVAKGYV